MVKVLKYKTTITITATTSSSTISIITTTTVTNLLTPWSIVLLERVNTDMEIQRRWHTVL